MVHRHRISRGIILGASVTSCGHVRAIILDLGVRVDVASLANIKHARFDKL